MIISDKLEHIRKTLERINGHWTLEDDVGSALNYVEECLDYQKSKEALLKKVRKDQND